MSGIVNHYLYTMKKNQQKTQEYPIATSDSQELFGSQILKNWEL